MRLDLKTDPEAVKLQAAWCGVKPGLKMLDVGCGSGKTASILYDMIQPGGKLVGIDRSASRIEYAQKHFGNKSGLDFIVCDFTKSIDGLGRFDLIWVRFVLEYFRENALDMVESLAKSLKPGGWMCLLDLDQNCMGHYPLTDAMETVLYNAMKRLESAHNFDPHAGRKLYAYLRALNFEEIEIDLKAHHLIYGDLDAQDQYNWLKKIQVVSEKAEDIFGHYPGGTEKFFSDFSTYLNDPGRFIYTPLILAKGKKPL